jgi:hypothetical protein
MISIFSQPQKVLWPRLMDDRCPEAFDLKQASEMEDSQWSLKNVLFAPCTEFLTRLKARSFELSAPRHFVTKLGLRASDNGNSPLRGHFLR